MTTTHALSTIMLTDRDHSRLSALAADQTGRRTDVGRLLAEEIGQASIVASENIPPHVVTMNSRLTVRDEDTGGVRTFTLVYPGEEDISIGNLSVMTPVGAALVGLAENETATWITRDGRTREMTLLKILYQPEANGHFDL